MCDGGSNFSVFYMLTFGKLFRLVSVEKQDKRPLPTPENAGLIQNVVDNSIFFFICSKS